MPIEKPSSHFGRFTNLNLFNLDFSF